MSRYWTRHTNEIAKSSWLRTTGPLTRSRCRTRSWRKASGSILPPTPAPDGRTNCYRYRVAVVEECVFDRTEAAHAINLFDMEQKYADVIGLSAALEYCEAWRDSETAADAVVSERKERAW